MVEDLSPEEWLQRPSDNSNHISWIVGHVIWARKAVLTRLETEWSQPWLSSFARGVKCNDETAFPPPDTLKNNWIEVSGVLATALDGASEDVLSTPSTQGPPSADGKISGVINFLAIHETYHLGQASYLRSWLGHKGLMG
jgi:uncharacterized damage-inducible protein DinB